MNRLINNTSQQNSTNQPAPRIANVSTVKKFKEHRLYKSIEDAGKKHKSRFNMGFAHKDLMKLIENVPVTRELEEIIKRSLDNATNNVDKRPMNKQRQVRDKWQPTHGLVFKNIPDNIPRQVIYTAITQKMGQLRRENGELLFKGGLKIRNFNWPNRTLNGLRNLFPVFVSQKDRDTLYKWASCQDYHIRLDLENHRDHPEYDMESDSWDRVVLVELPRNTETGEFHDQSRPVNNTLPINIVDEEIEPQRTRPAEFYGAITPPVQNLPSIHQNMPTTTIFNPVNINSFSLPTTPPLMYPSGASSPMSMNSDFMMNMGNGMGNVGNMRNMGNMSPNLQNMGMNHQNLQNLGNMSPTLNNYQNPLSYSSNNSSPIGPYGSTQNFQHLPLEIQKQSMTQQFSQISTKETSKLHTSSSKGTEDVFKEALGRVKELEQAKGHLNVESGDKSGENGSGITISKNNGESAEKAVNSGNDVNDVNDGNSTPISDAQLASDEMD